MEEVSFKWKAHPPFSPDVTSSDLFLFDWLGGELSSWHISEIDGLFKAVGGILGSLIPETIARAFRNWIERLEQITNTNGDDG
jgi:hypothetical protein